MKKIFTLFISVLCIQIIVYSQVTITDLDPQVGDYFSLEGYESSIDPGSAGANVIWDFSALGIADNEINYEVVLTDGLSGEENFPLSTKAWTATIDGLDELNFFVGSDNNAILEYGTYFVLNTSFTEINYSDPQKRYDSPLDYGDTGSDDVAGSLTTGGMALSTFTGDIEYDVDGYGTLILPSGTYTDALRVHTVQEEIHSLSVGGIIQTTTVIGYSYFVEDFPIPVLIIEDTESYVLGELFDEFSSMTRLVSYNNVLVSIDELVEKTNVSIYPNPSSSFITLDFDYAGVADVRILSLDGKEIRSLAIQANTTIDISEIDRGFYICELSIDGHVISSSPFIISN